MDWVAIAEIMLAIVLASVVIDGLRWLREHSGRAAGNQGGAG